jgi:phage N-6-adenine-methyltransferase
MEGQRQMTSTSNDTPPSTSLVPYDTARRALAECVRVDDVKKLHDEFAATAEYARRQKDTQLIRHATKIRFLAERRLGELLAKTQKNKGAAGGGKKDAPRGRVTQPRDKTPKLRDFGLTKTQSSKFQNLAKLPADKYEARVTEAMARAEQATTSAPRYSKAEFTGKFEWYTPAQELELARRVLGAFDLTPFSNDIAQKIAKAKVYYTIKDDAFKHEWHGRTFMNPPYSKTDDICERAVKKLVEEFRAGNVPEAIMLVNNSTDTDWWRLAYEACSAVCFTLHRIKFYNPQDELAAPTQGSAFLYFGKHPDKFFEVFKERGNCWEPMR